MGSLSPLNFDHEKAELPFSATLYEKDGETYRATGAVEVVRVCQMGRGYTRSGGMYTLLAGPIAVPGVIGDSRVEIEMG